MDAGPAPVDFAAVGEIVGGYRLEAVVGAGGMGVVYRATDPELGRSVAVKLIAPQFARDPRFRELFIRESTTAAQLEHPNVIPVYRAGEDGGRLYIAMRFVEGTSLEQLIARRGALPPALAVRLVAQVASALDAAHGRGLVHRDVKPGNVMIAGGDGDEQVYLTDFGLSARMSEHDGGPSGRWAGTLAYLAPEQIRGGPLTARSDVYALGCVLFDALAGRPPFTGDTVDDVLAAHLTAPAPHVSDAAPGMPPGFDEVVARAMAKRPEDRYATAGELGRALLALRFDLFLCHGPGEEGAAAALAGHLRAADVTVWSDGRRSRDARPEDLMEGLRASAACAVLVGAAGLGGWARSELTLAQDLAERDRGFRIVTVLLPGAPDPFDPGLAFLAARPWVDLRAGLDDPDGLRHLARAVRGEAVPAVAHPSLAADACPYRGLEPFDEGSAELFFGREDDTARLVERLRTGRFLGVLGPSGSGKSSLVRAGLVSALRHDALPESQAWRVQVFTPGARPLDALAAQVAALVPPGGGRPDAGALRADEAALDRALGQAGVARALLIVDQFEELFTLCADEEERRAFLDALLFAATVPGGRAMVVVAMRADFYPRCAEHPELRALIADRQFLVGPLGPRELRRAIEEPAALAGLELEEGLTRRILTDVAERPGSLPLVQHLLTELWRRRRGGTLTLEAYAASGGVEGALAKRANEVYAGLPPERQAIARRVLLRLTQPGEGTEDTRRRAETRELVTRPEERDDVEAVVGALTDARLLTAGRDETTGEPTVEVAHEALIRGWPELRTWIGEDREALRQHRRLTEAAAEWERSDRDEGGLYRGARLLAWQDRDTGDLNDAERAFLAASRERSDRDRAARRRRVRLGFAGLGAALVAVATVAGIALWQRSVADAERQAALSQSLVNASSLQLSQDPELALLLAAQGYTTRVDRASEDELRRALHESHVRAAFRLPQGQFTSMVDLGGGRMALLTDTGAMRTWNFVGDRTGSSAPTVGWPGGPLVDSAAAAGGRVATIDQQGAIRVGRPAAAPTLLGRQAGAAAIAAGPGGRELVTVGADGVARRWSVAGGRAAVVAREATPLVSVAAAADGVVLVDDETGTLSAWRNGRRIAAPTLAGVNTNWLSASPDGRLVGAAAVDGFTVWRVDGGRLVKLFRRPAAQGINWVAFAPDGRTAATAGGDGRVRLWSIAGGRSLGVLLGHQGSVQRLVFDGPSHRLVSTGPDGSARAWDWPSAVNPAIAIGALPLKGSVAFLPGGRPVIIDANGRMLVWAPGSGRTTPAIGPSGAGVSAATLSADGQTLVTAAQDGRLVARDRSGRRLLATSLGQGNPDQLGVSRAGREVAGATDAAFFRIAVRPDARPAKSSLGSPVSAAISPDGRLAVGGTRDGTTVLWRGGATLTTLGRQEGQVAALAFGPDGRHVASAGFDGLVRVLDVTGAEPTIVLRGHRDRVFDVGFSPDGRYLGSAGLDGMRLWDWRRGVSVLDVPNGAARDVGVAVGPGGRRILVADDQGVVHQITCDVCVPQDRLVALARGRVTRDLSPQERKDFTGG